MVILIIALYFLIGFFEIFPLLKGGQYQKLWLYGALFLAAFVISILLSLDIKIPTPAKPIQKIVEMVMKK